MRLKIIGVSNLERYLSAVSANRATAVLIRPQAMIATYVENLELLTFEVEAANPDYRYFNVSTPYKAVAEELYGVKSAVDYIVAFTHMSGLYNFYVWTDGESARKDASKRPMVVEVSEFEEKKSFFDFEFED